MKKFFEKSILVFIISSLIFGGGVFIKPQKVEAVVLVSDIVHTESTVTGVATTISGWAKDAWQWIQDNWQKMMRDIIAKRIMDYIVNETVKWIQGGGKPKFIGNWEGFVKDVGDIAFDSVIREVGLEKLCTPFGLNIMIGLLPVEDFSQRITCTLDKVVSNIQNFYVDFSVGGWRGYNLLWQPENNYYGVAINIADEVMKRTAEKKDAAKSEGLAGSGFMGDKICKAGSSISGNLDYGIQQEGGGGEECSNELEACFLRNPDGSGPAFCQSKYDACVASAKQNLNEKLGGASDGRGGYCHPDNLVNATPGSLIGKAVGEAITSDSKWAANIQSWVSALVNAVINRVIKEGVGMMAESLGGGKKDSYYPAEYQTVRYNEFERDKEQMYGKINRFTNEWKYLFNAKDQSLFYASSTLAALQQLQQIQLTQTPLPLACEPIVTGQDIQAVKNEINRLTAEMQALQVKINAADSVTKQIADADFLDEFQRIAASTAYQNFINQYGTTAQIEAIVSGSDRQAADTDAQTKQTELDNIQARLNACQAAITPPQAP